MADYILDKIGYILIDFDNWIKKPLNLISDEELEFQFSTILLNFINNDNFDRINVRLYGGWYKNGLLTARASELQMKLAQISVFPYINKEKKEIIRGKIDVVNSTLNVPELRWTNTYHERLGVPRLRINQDKLSDACHHNPDICPVRLLNNFTRHKGKRCTVPGCENEHSDVFVTREQKMVDTIIASDLMYCCKEQNISNVQLISDDIDHLPALIDSSFNSSPTGKYSLVMRNQKTLDTYSEIFEQYDINFIKMDL